MLPHGGANFNPILCGRAIMKRGNEVMFLRYSPSSPLATPFKARAAIEPSS